MDKTVIAFVGSYRKNGIIDQAVDAVLEGARRQGAAAEKIYLSDKDIEFCTNCRTCTQSNPQNSRGECVLKDDMNSLLEKLDSAGGLVFASPINFFTVTALMKRFVERFIAYLYWPWSRHAPKERIRKKNKKAVLITSSACPAFLGKLLMPNAFQVLKACAGVTGAKVVRKIYIGTACLEAAQRLSEKQIRTAQAAGMLLAGGP